MQFGIKPRALVVDDEEAVRLFLEDYLSANDFRVDAAASGEEALELLSRYHYDLIISDIRMPGVDGFGVLKEARVRMPKTPVVLITAYSEISQAVEAIKLGAYDYLPKPFTAHQLDPIIARVKRLALALSENRRLRSMLGGEYPFLGTSAHAKRILELVQTFANINAPVLITGESGVGKEVVARMLHYYSERADKPFCAVSCPALPETLLESELFGHEAGAFTGATKRRVGKFEAANGGTLLLDEITETSIQFQTKLLRVLQEGEIQRLGSSEVIPVDVRVVATTNQDIEKLVEEGKFRQDLFFRINVLRIDIPPLRARKEDIPVLVNYYLERTCAMMGKKKLVITKDAMKALMDYDYPGNVRELINIIQSAAAVADEVIDVEHLRFMPKGAPRQVRFSPGVTLEDMERELILDALRYYGGNRTKAANALGITPRTLRNKLKFWRQQGIEIPDEF